jgi:hypothetical protein
VGVGVGDSQGNELEDVGVGVDVGGGLGPAKPIYSFFASPAHSSFPSPVQGPPIIGDTNLQVVITLLGSELQTTVPADKEYVSVCIIPWQSK